MPMSNHEILEELDRRVHGHTEAKKLLINLVNRSKLRYVQKWHYSLSEELLANTLNCTLVGRSGNGKTFLIEQLAEIMDFPYFKVDCSQFTHTSAGGGINQKDLSESIYNKAKEYLVGNKSRYSSIDGTMDQMIVFCDEVCKLARSPTASSDWQKETQGGFLTAFDKYGDIKGVSWVFAGAFSGMEYGKSKESRNTIGFVTGEDTSPNNEIESKIIQYGMIPELVGRMGVITVLDELTENDYMAILVSKIMPKKLLSLYHMGIDGFKLSEECMLDIIQKAQKSGLGVRYMQQAVDRIAIQAEFEQYKAPSHFGVNYLSKNSEEIAPQDEMEDLL